MGGHSVDLSGLPDTVLMTVCTVFEHLRDDPYAVLATWAYIACGLTVTEITQLVILSDKSGTRTASREYIRLKVISTFNKIKNEYIREYGDTGYFVSPRYRDRNMDPVEVTGVGEQYNYIIKETLDDHEDSTEEELFLHSNKFA